MASRNTLLRSMHDIGLASWFGGSLMGTVGLNGAASTAKNPTERLTISSAGWAKWAPVLLGSMVAHAVGSVGMLVTDADRVALQKGARTPVVAKTVLTVAAAGVSLYSAIVGSKQAKHADEGAAGATEPSASQSHELQAAQKQQKVLQWVIPALTGVLLVLAAQQGEMQRPQKGLSALLARTGLRSNG